MTTLLQAKQIKKVLSAFVPITGLFSGTGNSSDITADLTTALSVAGNQGNSVPLSSSPDPLTVGVIADSPYNQVKIFDGNSGAVFSSATGEEVYGRVTTPDDTIWTLSYYTNEAGTETPYTFPANTAINVDVTYRFDFKDLPVDSPLTITGATPSDDPSTNHTRTFSEPLTITTTNQIPPLSFIPADATEIHLFINGADEHILDGSFTSAADILTWITSVAGYDLEPTDVVVVEYLIDPIAVSSGATGDGGEGG